MYFRITGYEPKNDISFILDCNGKFEKLWEFSSYLRNKGLRVPEVNNDNDFLDGNIKRAREHPDFLYVQAVQRGKPAETTLTINGKTYRAIEVCGKRYVPDRKDVIK